jgi:hypothetical protein
MSTAILPSVDTQSSWRERIVSTLVGAVVILGAVFNGAVGALSLLSPTTFLAVIGQSTPELTPGVLAFAGYAGARELAIAVGLVVLLAVRATPALAGVLVVAALANAIDAAGAVTAQRWVQLPGAVVFALAYASAAIWFWRASTRSSGPG